ncbi:hypothetical protein, partial [Listeria monocytogenes]|uniref:hypothetical protein n=1 Tax=Listeria monocytogenes TaxID=1639 RepID=UPI003FA451A6
GLIWLDDPKVFAQVMAHDVAVDQVRTLAAVQQTIAASAFAEPVMHAAWHDKPAGICSRRAITPCRPPCSSSLPLP